MITLLDGPVGTELLARGVPTPIPLWSAAAITTAPEVLGQIHAEYAHAGATVHTANTFRTKRRQVGADWELLARRAVAIARAAVPAGHRVAGSIAPLEDCYSPQLSPRHCRPEHRELARALADAGADILLCETFPHVGEALVAVEESVSTGVATWASFTAGPDASLLTPVQVREAAKAAIAAGASAVLINCVPASVTLAYVHALSGLGVPFGAYANAGSPEESMGWAALPGAPDLYVAQAEHWIAAGASLVGSCCGTGPAHVAALAKRFGSAPSGRFA